MEQRDELTVWEEHLFWLEILQDHAYFVRDNLPPEYTKELEAVKWYIAAFGERIEELGRLEPGQPAHSAPMVAFARAAWPVAEGYYRFEGRLQRLRVSNELLVNLTPTYFNGTLNENAEYLRLLEFYVQGQVGEPLSLWALLDLWLEDQLGHAVLLRGIVDPIELGVIAKTDVYVQQFQAFILQNHHIRGYLRFSPPGIPRQQELASEVGKASLEMNAFIIGVIGRYRERTLLNRTTLRFLEHHLPETCYFVRKLSRFAPELAGPAGACSIRRVSGP